MFDGMKAHGLYTLDARKNPVPVSDFMQYVEIMQSDCRRVALDHLNGCKISTVFLGVSYSLYTKEPLLFETMVFTRRKGSYRRLNYRSVLSATWGEAEEYHFFTVQMIKRKRITELSILFGYQ